MKGNILVVDDEPAALKLLKDILTAEGHEVRPFDNGELALRSVMAEAPELILLDIRMPGMDGFEVCRRIKENERLKEIPVIFISAALDTEVPLSEGSPLHITTSIGATSLLEDDISIEMILKRADKALYEAKATGRNRVCI